jgi:hypothetical protein
MALALALIFIFVCLLFFCVSCLSQGKFKEGQPATGWVEWMFG